MREYSLLEGMGLHGGWLGEGMGLEADGVGRGPLRRLYDGEGGGGRGRGDEERETFWVGMRV